MFEKKRFSLSFILSLFVATSAISAPVPTGDLGETLMELNSDNFIALDGYRKEIVEKTLLSPCSWHHSKIQCDMGLFKLRSNLKYTAIGLDPDGSMISSAFSYGYTPAGDLDSYYDDIIKIESITKTPELLASISHVVGGDANPEIYDMAVNDAGEIFLGLWSLGGISAIEVRAGDGRDSSTIDSHGSQFVAIDEPTDNQANVYYVKDDNSVIQHNLKTKSEHSVLSQDDVKGLLSGENGFRFTGIAASKDGQTVYAAFFRSDYDVYDSMVVKKDVNGHVEVIAGKKGMAAHDEGSTVKNGPAVDALLGVTHQLKLDWDTGTLFFLDNSGSAIRAIYTDKSIRTVIRRDVYSSITPDHSGGVYASTGDEIYHFIKQTAQAEHGQLK